MAHPYAAHRQSIVEKERVGKIARGYATGGGVAEVREDAASTKTARARVGKVIGKMDGKKSMARMDKRARGGPVKAKGTNINIIVGQPKGDQQPIPVPVPVPAGPPPGPPPGPMAGPPGMPPGAMPPPGMPPMRKKGGGVFAAGVKAGTQVSHTKNKVQAPPKGASLPFATGGAAPGVKGTMRGGEKMDAGAGSGEGRLEKAAKQKRA